MRMANIERLLKEIEAMFTEADSTSLKNESPVSLLEDIDASWEIRISDDRLRVYLDMYPPVGKGARLDPAVIWGELEKIGIRDVDRDKVTRLAQFCESGISVSGEDLVVARGAPPVAPIEGKVEFLVPMEKTRLMEDDEGSIDWKNLWVIPSVRKGDVIARILLPKEGIDGLDVYGKPLTAKSYATFQLRYGDGVVVTEGNGTVEIVSALASGQPVFRNNTIDVLPLLVINGNVDITVGNIDFSGSVLVNGSLLEGFSIRADQNVTVMGGMYNGRICSGGDCIVKGGVVGEQSEVDSGADVRVGIVEYGRVTAAGNIEIFGYSLFANLEGGNYVYVQGRNRRGIIGGHCVAGAGINTLAAGSPMEPSTILEAGRDLTHSRAQLEMGRKKAALELMKGKIEGAIFSIKGSKPEIALDQFAEEEKEKLLLLSRYYEKMDESIAQISQWIEEGKRVILAGRRAPPKIQIQDRAYPNVTLRIWDSQLRLKSQELHVTFSFDKEKHEIIRSVF